MGYDIVKTEAVSEFRDVFVALRTGLPPVFGELLFEQKCTVVVATPLVAAKNDFPRSHLQYYVTNYIPAAQTYVNNFARPSPLCRVGLGTRLVGGWPLVSFPCFQLFFILQAVMSWGGLGTRLAGLTQLVTSCSGKHLIIIHI